MNNSGETSSEKRDDEQPQTIRPTRQKAASPKSVNDFVLAALNRKGLRVSLKPATVRVLAQEPGWEPEKRAETLSAYRADKSLAVPRQLLLASRGIVGYPFLRGALRDFVRDTLLQHPLFGSESLNAGVRNLDGSPDIRGAIEELEQTKFEVVSSWPDWSRPSKKAFRPLVLNAAGTLALWYVESRGTEFAEVLSAMAVAVWMPAVSKLSNNDEKLRMITEAKDVRALGVAYSSLRGEIRAARDRESQWKEIEADLRAQLLDARNDAAILRPRIEELEAKLQEVRNSAERRVAEKETQLAHARQDHDELRARLGGVLRREIRNLEEAIVALKRPEPYIDVTLDYVDRVIEKLRNESGELGGER